MQPTGPRHPSTLADGGGAAGIWSNPSNAGASDGVYASGNISSGGASTNNLKATNFGFNIPSVAIILGIYVEFERYGLNAQTANIQLLKGSALTGTAKVGTDIWPASEAYISYGGSGDLWGATLSASDINSSSFGVAISASNTHGGGTAFIDDIRITVYWQVPPSNVPRRYAYKVYRNGLYLGDLPNVTSEFTYSEEINSVGSQITITVPVSVDTSSLPNGGSLMDETGATLLDEAGDTLTVEGAVSILGIGGAGGLIANGNRVVVWEYGYWYPNGKLIYQGVMERIEADLGGDSGKDDITILVYGDGGDLDNHLLLGSPFVYTADQVYAQWDSAGFVAQSGAGDASAYTWYGQKFTVGSGVTNLAAVAVELNGAGQVTLAVYSSPSSTTPLATTTQAIDTGGNVQQVQFNFPAQIAVVPGTQYFFAVTVGAGTSVTIYFKGTGTYSGGTMYTATFSGGSGGAWTAVTGSDLYFETYSSNGVTDAMFSAQDPSTGILAAFMADYRGRGGLIGVTSASIDATGLSLPYDFTTNTVLEGIQAMLTVAPNGFYYYVDQATDILYFKQVSSTADFHLTKGIHINKLRVIATIEQLKNQDYFSGGQISGVNYYAFFQDIGSIALYGPRLARSSDNRVVDSVTAAAIGNSLIEELKTEDFQTTVTILETSMDITLLKLGKMVDFRGYGNFIDSLLLQIVRREYHPGYVDLTLGKLPKRLNPDIENLTRMLTALQTIANPSTPS